MNTLEMMLTVPIDEFIFKRIMEYIAKTQPFEFDIILWELQSKDGRFHDIL